MSSETPPALPSDPGLYDYFPWNQRPKIAWPNGARIAFWVAPNIEYYEFDPPAHPTRPVWPRPFPDVQSYTWRDYGNRVGVWRMMDAMDTYGVPGSVSLSIAVCQHHPEIIEACVARNWELMSHGVYNTRYYYGMDEAQERAVIEDSIRTIKEASGQDLAGWLTPALTGSLRTFDLLAEYGIKYICDLYHDDQPTPINVKSGQLISLPYSIEVNDIIVYHYHYQTPRGYGEMLKRQFDTLYAEGGTVMCIPLHPFVVGAASRIGPFADVLKYITSHKDVWVTTGREIADWYTSQGYYDQAQASLAAVRDQAAQLRTRA